MKGKTTIIILTGLIVGIPFYLWHNSEIKKLEVHYQQKIQKLQSQLITPSGAEFFKVYSMDPNTYEVIIDFYVRIQKNLPLIDKLKILAAKLSKLVFDYYPINVLRIKNRNGKRIAVIELKEPDFPNAFTWSGGYFQGTAGGMSKTITLRGTFLQVDYPGEWIDGVEFYYEGEPISRDWDHIGLSGIIYR